MKDYSRKRDASLADTVESFKKAMELVDIQKKEMAKVNRGTITPAAEACACMFGIRVKMLAPLLVTHATMCACVVDSTPSLPVFFLHHTMIFAYACICRPFSHVFQPHTRLQLISSTNAVKSRAVAATQRAAAAESVAKALESSRKELLKEAEQRNKQVWLRVSV